jgi:dTDP-4-amino-4,6-dideoxygalactose transaminase
LIPAWVPLAPPLSPLALLERPPGERPYPLSEPGCRLFVRARDGLHVGARQLGIGPGDVVLVPAFHHGSEVEALRRTGAAVEFYDCGEALEPDEAALERLLDARVRALYLIHYLGFPQDGARWRRWCDERELVLIEDAAQSWLARSDGKPVGSFGSLAIFCLYKVLGLGEPGALICDRPPPFEPHLSATDLRSAAGGVRGWLYQRVDPRPLVGRRPYVPFQADAETEFELGDPDQPRSRIAQALARRAREAEIVGRRRRNFQLLFERFSERVPAAFGPLPAGASPLQFPLLVDDKARALETLADEGVQAADPWPLAHPSMEPGRFRRAQQLRTSWIGLPVHQGLGRREMERVARGALRALGR